MKNERLHSSSSDNTDLNIRNPIQQIVKSVAKKLNRRLGLKNALKNFNLLAAATTLTFVSLTPAHADWSFDGQLTTLQPDPRLGGILIGHERSTNSTWGGCSSNEFFFLSQSNPLYQQIQSLVTSSFLNGSEVDVYVEGCEQGYPEIRKVKVR